MRNAVRSLSRAHLSFKPTTTVSFTLDASDGSQGILTSPLMQKNLNRPESTTILGAAKIVGRTQSNTTFGIMEAVTAREYAQIKQAGSNREHLIEPLTNHFVGRINQDVLKGNSRVGLITTAVNRQDANAAYVGGLDWDLKFAKERYQIGGTVAGSLVEGFDTAKYQKSSFAQIRIPRSP